MEFVGAVNAEDSSLALQVQRVADALKMKKAQLTVLQRREQRQLTALRARQAVLNGQFAEQQQLLNDLSSKQQEAASLLSDLASRRTHLSNLVSSLNASLARQARLAAARAAHAQQQGAPLGGGGGPVTFDHPFSYCPVAGPHAYSDSFGAPRYTTNPPHPHAGNDIFAPRGTPVVAPFSGYASANPNGLGGNAVVVSGPNGYVYNAHLDHYGTLGSVSAGTVVGYVGNTGDAQGGATHDHFEWHPSPIPSQLWQSPYGYTNIDGAIDPFPYLNQVC
jgi:murein DD-endopeptidase MepM/ murein hydrolase activator NlpD